MQKKKGLGGQICLQGKISVFHIYSLSQFELSLILATIAVKQAQT